MEILGWEHDAWIAFINMCCMIYYSNIVNQQMIGDYGRWFTIPRNPYVTWNRKPTTVTVSHQTGHQLWLRNANQSRECNISPLKNGAWTVGNTTFLVFFLYRNSGILCWTSGALRHPNWWPKKAPEKAPRYVATDEGHCLRTIGGVWLGPGACKTPLEANQTPIVSYNF